MIVPQSFRDMPRFWREGPEWLDALPDLVSFFCTRWGLLVSGVPVHGSNALVVPVTRDDVPYALRLTPPVLASVSGQIDALRFWDGRGTVLLAEADPEAGVMLLEWLSSSSLGSVPVPEAMSVLGAVMRRIAVPLATGPRTSDLVAARLTTVEEQWVSLGRPFPRALLRRAMEAGSRLTGEVPDLAVNGDLHSEQVLRGRREPWLVVDPVLLRGDVGFDLGRVLWTRLDEMADIVGCFDLVVGAAGLERDRARDCVVWRAVDYWLWGLGAGLTEDPARCRRLVAAFDG
ncbi:aminoglycoside phosphotransferase family protein [Actinoplanes sp. GCM10030250]|uniref:aminoglycoside phosphotransferase family protein n=1 Tax=Actinoplanes sp. GCM10030250 TaxID=3273376 RepID=UPI0036206C7D